MTSCSFADLDIALDSWDFGHMIQPFRKDLLPAMVSHHGRHGHLFSTALAATTLTHGWLNISKLKNVT